VNAGTIVRRRRRDTEVDETAAWLCFDDGLIIDSRACPVGRLNRSHWTRTSDAVDMPNAVCAHEES
jgi:hypothetical protein